VALLVVDGYNIINSWPEFEELREEKMEIARIKLVEMLEEFVPLLWPRIIIVFDAYRIKGKRANWESRKGLEVVYTSEGQTADAFIERLVANLRESGEDIEVASSDNLEQHLVLWKGGRRLSSRELRKLLKECREEIMKSNLPPSRDNLDERLSEKVRSTLEKWRRL